jgi:lipopolysaccharide transport system permease protein
MLLFTLLFSNVAQIPTGDIPYPLFALSGLVLWNFISHGLTRSTSSLVENYQLVCKVYIPRLVLPISAVMAALADFLLAFALLVVLMFVYGVAPSPAVVLVPFIIAMTVATTLGVGLWLTTFNVRYRDVANALPFALQILLFATPIAYPSSLIPPEWQTLYALNPLVSVVEGFRWALLGGHPPSILIVGISLLVALAILTSGLYFFRHREPHFADII